MRAERTKWAWLGAIALSVLIVTAILLARLRQTPPLHTFYFAGGYNSSSGRPLFSIAALPVGYRVESKRFRCRPTSAGADQNAKQFTVGTDVEFRCDEHLLELRQRGDTPILTSVGFTDLAIPFIVGSGFPVGAERSEAPRYVYRAPGVGVRHLIALPAGDCGGAANANAAFCAQNGGASGSMLLFPMAGTPVSMKHGQSRVVSDGDTLWLGYVPFQVSRASDGKVTLRAIVSDGDRSWRTMRGERLWQGLDLPSWSLTSRDPSAPPGAEFFVSEAARFSKGFLSKERYEPEQEEQLQLLIDHELLCLESSTPSPRDAKLVWRPPYEPGCVDYGVVPPVRNRREPPSETALRAYQQVQSEDRFGELLAQTATNLRSRQWETDPTSNLFVYDFRYALAPPTASGVADLERVPVALLGVRPKVTTVRLSPPAPPLQHPIAFREASTSPTLDLVTTGAEPHLLLLLAARPAQNGAAASMAVCTGSPLGTRQEPVPAALPLGSVALRPDGVWWTADLNAGGRECVELVRNGATVTARAADVAAARQPADGSAEVPIAGTAIPLAAGDIVRIGTRRFRYTTASDVAAFSLPHGGGRVYPFGADAVTLLGIGSTSAGVEGAMSGELRTELSRESKRRQSAGQPETPLRLTIDGDMQRIVSRELLTAFREKTNGAPAPGVRASAVVLDAENGAVLAVANAPGFDPWNDDQDEKALLDAMRGEVVGVDGFRTRIQNWAFLRHLAIGSTMKVATSMAMQREGLPLSDSDNTSGESCQRRLEIRLAGGNRIDEFGCTHDNRVLLHGAPDPAHWLPAFYGSCNVYFGGAAALLVPELGPSIFTNGPVATIPVTFDPAVALQPHELAPANQPRVGNGFYETLLTLGYRFDFHDAREAPPQRVKRYRNLDYPTVVDPWLWGLNVEAAFAYPTVPAPELFTNTFRGGDPMLRPHDLFIDGKVIPHPHWSSQDWMRQYFALGWGQIMEGSVLSIAVSGVPAFNSRGEVRSPQIFAMRLARAGAPQSPSLLTNAQQLVLQKGFREVIANPHGTANTELSAMRAAAEGLGYQVGGKTGTIQLEKPATRTSSADVVERARWWGCGVMGFDLSDAEWAKAMQAAGKNSALAAAYPTRPAHGFAAASSACDGLNPGMPRVRASALSGVVEQDWSELPSLEWRASQDRQSNSSAFLAAIAPNAGHATAKRRLIIGITFDLDAAGAKKSTDRIVHELVRLLAARRE